MPNICSVPSLHLLQGEFSQSIMQTAPLGERSPLHNQKSKWFLEFSGREGEDATSRTMHTPLMGKPTRQHLNNHRQPTGKHSNNHHGKMDARFHPGVANPSKYVALPLNLKRHIYFYGGEEMLFDKSIKVETLAGETRSVILWLSPNNGNHFHSLPSPEIPNKAVNPAGCLHSSSCPHIPGAVVPGELLHPLLDSPHPSSFQPSANPPIGSAPPTSHFPFHSHLFPFFAPFSPPCCLPPWLPSPTCQFPEVRIAGDTE